MEKKNYIFNKIRRTYNTLDTVYRPTRFFFYRLLAEILWRGGRQLSCAANDCAITGLAERKTQLTTEHGIDGRAKPIERGGNNGVVVAAAVVVGVICSLLSVVLTLRAVVGSGTAGAAQQLTNTVEVHRYGRQRTIAGRTQR